MRLVLYGTELDRNEIMGSFAALPNWRYRKISVSGYSDYDDFVTELSEGSPDCIVITVNGAEGMEGVIAARSICEHVPVRWFSDDSGFGVQSYRLGCAYGRRG